MSSAAARGFVLDIGSHTEVGKVRDHNEDSMRTDPARGLFVVADGMGGHNAGERASFLAVQELFLFLEHLSGNPTGEDFGEAFRRANGVIFKEASEMNERHGMGTTMTALLLDGDTYRIAHVGDSRAWRVRRGRAEQLTSDHSVMGEQLRRGLITPEQAERHPLRNVLTRSLGNLPEVEVDVLEGTILDGDTFVLASDGMIRALDEDGIAAHVGRAQNAQAAARDMVLYACEHDGTDNVTAVVVRCQAE